MTVVKTCIICGGSARSREHIFPGALGGRRTNKGIYCDAHNKAYSPLAEVLAVQLEHFNAPLGVVSDHAKQVRTAQMTDIATGLSVQMNATTARFSGPRFVTPYTPGEPFHGEIRFSTLAEANAWAEAQRKLGMKVEFGKVGPPQRFMLSGAHGTIDLGGPLAFRAIGYIGQTFFAHLFPDVARRPSLSAFKAWTLKGAGEDQVWWDFAPPTDLADPTSEFEHRVVVGIDGQGRAYARVSFFSSLHFAMILGEVGAAPASAVVRIDPLARAAPADMHTVRIDAAVGEVERPPDLTASLQDGVASGKAIAAIGALFERIERHQLRITATRLSARFAGVEALTPAARRTLFSAVVDEQSQRYWSIANAILRDFLSAPDGALLRATGFRFEALIAPDLESSNGLTPLASDGLQRVCGAMEARFERAFESRSLDPHSIEDLLAGGETRAAILEALLEPIIAFLRRSLDDAGDLPTDNHSL